MLPSEKITGLSLRWSGVACTGAFGGALRYSGLDCGECGVSVVRFGSRVASFRSADALWFRDSRFPVYPRWFRPVPKSREAGRRFPREGGLWIPKD
ncbi:MAG: hypothetical protein CL927_11985 [Deltaproteobacteria bacterium]|nr:hypothetical protein [Deltaproteobacteria bacterium]HCH64118.1 hypothetical protein [Deltaproteobacteria bacterium]